MWSFLISWDIAFVHLSITGCVFFYSQILFCVCVCVTERVGGGVPLFTVGFAYALFLVIVVHTLP